MQLPRVRTWRAPQSRAFGPKSAAAYYAARQYLLMVRAIARGATKRNSWTSVREVFEMAMENGDVEPLMRAQVRCTEVLGKSPYPRVEYEKWKV